MGGGVSKMKTTAGVVAKPKQNVAKENSSKAKSNMNDAVIFPKSDTFATTSASKLDTSSPVRRSQTMIFQTCKDTEDMRGSDTKRLRRSSTNCHTSFLSMTQDLKDVESLESHLQEKYKGMRPRVNSAISFEQMGRKSTHASKELDKILRQVKQAQTRFEPYCDGGSRVLLGRKRGRGAVSSESSKKMIYVDLINDKSPLEDKEGPEIARLVCAAFSNSPLFCMLSEDQRDIMLHKLTPVSKDPGEAVVTQGEAGESFFIVVAGGVNVSISRHSGTEREIGHNTVVAHIGPGGTFGELALMYNYPRTASVIATDVTRLWELSRTQYRSIVAGRRAHRRHEMKLLFQEIPMFRWMKPRNLSSLLNMAEEIHISHGEELKRDALHNFVYVVVSGTLVLNRNNIEEKSTGNQEIFGRGGWFGVGDESQKNRLDSLGKVSEDHHMLFSTSDWLLSHAFPKWKVVSNAENESSTWSMTSRESIVGEGGEKEEREKEEGEEKMAKEEKKEGEGVMKCVLQHESQKNKSKVRKRSDTNNKSQPSSDNNDSLATSLMTTLIRFPTAEVLELLDHVNINTQAKDMKVSLLERSHLIGGLPTLILEAISEVAITQKYQPGKPILNQGEEGKSVFVLVYGQITETDEESSKQLNDGAIFGENFVVKDEMKRTASYVAVTHVLCFEIPFSTFTQETLEQLKHMSTPEKETVSIETAVKTLGDLKVLDVLGVGSFGSVNLVVSHIDKTEYALKKMDKLTIFNLAQNEHVIDEKKITGEVDHPFITKLFATFQDERYLYLLLEVHLGGELLNLFDSDGHALDEASAKFYAGSLLLALEHLHDKNIAYRDIKPENLVLDADGFPKLVDFGFARVITDLSYTFCGTLEYMAPEVLKNEGHNGLADVWSFGVFVYELLHGYTPFSDKEDYVDDTQIIENILNDPISYSSNTDNSAVSELIDSLCTKLYTDRPSMASVRERKWFEEIDFGKLVRKEVTPPFLPMNLKASSRQSITMSCDDYDEDQLAEAQADADREWEQYHSMVDQTIWENW